MRSMPSVLTQLRDEGREGWLLLSKLLLKISAGSENVCRAFHPRPPRWTAIRKFRDAVEKDRGEETREAPSTDEILACRKPAYRRPTGVLWH